MQAGFHLDYKWDATGQPEELDEHVSSSEALSVWHPPDTRTSLLKAMKFPVCTKGDSVPNIQQITSHFLSNGPFLIATDGGGTDERARFRKGGWGAAIRNNVGNILRCGGVVPGLDQSTKATETYALLCVLSAFPTDRRIEATVMIDNLAVVRQANKQLTAWRECWTPWQTIMQRIGAHEVQVHWIPSHGKHPEWRPPAGHSHVLWRHLNALADVPASAFASVHHDREHAFHEQEAILCEWSNHMLHRQYHATRRFAAREHTNAQVDPSTFAHKTPPLKMRRDHTGTWGRYSLKAHKRVQRAYDDSSDSEIEGPQPQQSQSLLTSDTTDEDQTTSVAGPAHQPDSSSRYRQQQPEVSAAQRPLTANGRSQVFPAGAGAQHNIRRNAEERYRGTQSDIGDHFARRVEALRREHRLGRARDLHARDDEHRQFLQAKNTIASHNGNWCVFSGPDTNWTIV